MSPLSPSRKTGASGQSSRGVTLIIVLATLVLLSAMVLAFFSSVTGASKGAALYQDQGRSKLLSDTVINSVIGQIRSATAPSADPASEVAWASQPGAIRRYSSSGSFLGGYKLYSS